MLTQCWRCSHPPRPCHNCVTFYSSLYHDDHDHDDSNYCDYCYNVYKDSDDDKKINDDN